MAPLIAYSEGNKVKIKKINSGLRLKKRLESMGIGIDKIVEIVKGPPGPIILKVENSKIALGFGEASKILAEKVWFFLN